MKTRLTINEAMEYCYRIGCVYPSNEESYYINSNLQGDGCWVECQDGEFYCLDIGTLPLAYDFISPTLDMLKEKRIIIENNEKEEPFDLSDCLNYFKERDFD